MNNTNVYFGVLLTGLAGSSLHEKAHNGGTSLRVRVNGIRKCNFFRR